MSCDPTSGNLPLAAQVCDDIRRSPTAMLRPPSPPPGSVGHMCSGYMGGSTSVIVSSAMNDGVISTFRDEFGCFSGRPHDAVLIYQAAIAGDQAALAAIEPGLRCADDPALLCVTELATGIRRAIDRASLAHAVARLNPFGVHLLSNKVGQDVCTIQIGPITDARLRTGPRLAGRCSIAVEGLEKSSSKPTVVFTEAWPVSAHATASHTWRVLLDGFAWNSKVVSVTQSGPVPPQLRG